MAVRITRAGVALTVGIILVTGLIISGLFWVKQTGEQARRDDAIAIAEQTLQQESANDGALNEGQVETSTDESTTDTSTTIPGDSPADTNESAPSSNEGASVNELPVTGGEGISSVIAVLAITFSVAAYLQSRRQLL